MQRTRRLTRRVFLWTAERFTYRIVGRFPVMPESVFTARIHASATARSG
jgi:hypothetical protein